MSAISPERGANPSTLFEPLEGRVLFSVALDYAGSVAQHSQKAAASVHTATPAATTTKRRVHLNYWPPVTLQAYTGAIAGSVSVAAIDVNADDHPDVIVNTADGYTTVLFNGTGGIFGSNGRFDNGTDPTHAHTQYTNSSVIFGPFTNSGRFDLAVASYDPYQNNSRYAILPSNGDGTFGIPLSQSGPGGPVTLLGAGDADGDNIVDLYGSFGTHAGPLINGGTGTFATTIAAGAALDSTQFFLADLNGDGLPDIIEANGGSSNNNGPTVRLGVSGGTFSSAIDLALPGGNLKWSFKVGDYNNDSAPDIIATDTGNATATGKITSHVYLLKGVGDGTFGAPVTLAKATNTNPTGSVPFYTVATGDFNKDGNDDLVIVKPNYSGKHIKGFALTTLLGTGKGTFYAGASRSLAGDDASIPKLVVADFDVDGVQDLLVAGLKTGQMNIYFTFPY